MRSEKLHILVHGNRRGQQKQQDKVNSDVKITVIIVVTKAATNISDMILPSSEPRLSKLLLEASSNFEPQAASKISIDMG